MNTCNKTILLDAADSLRTLFGDVRRSVQLGGYVFCGGHADLLDILFRGLNSAAEAGASIDVTEKLNEIVRLTPRRCLLELLEDEFFEMLLMRELDIKAYLRGGSVDQEQIEFFRNNFLELEKGIVELRKCAVGKRINPAVNGCLAGKSILNESPEKIVTVAAMRDPFAASRTFRYVRKEFRACTVKSIAVEKFFGFHPVRERFREHLCNFTVGKENLPLMVSSLPGLGKTQFSINYTLNCPELTLVFAEPETLSDELEELIGFLALRKHRKFVVFFDDIEPEKIDWYSFRTNVGGSAVLPENITFILASNYQFPVNILSRGREITFPVFDELRCLEMVEDFLADFGMKNVDENLASVIAAGYIEDFGQKFFTELSPRTLIRYLEKFRHDGELRKRMLELSRQEMIVRPDAQLFYEFNIKQLRQLYGESFIDELREEKLRELGS